MRGLKRYLYNILVWMTQTLNVFTGGDPDEMMSSRLGKGVERGCKFCVFACDVLTFLDWRKGNHCLNAIERDEGKNSL